MSQSFGMLYVADGATGQLIGAAAKMTGFSTAGPAAGGSTGGDQSVVPVVASDKITVKGGGTYKVDFSLSGTTDGTADIQANLRVASAEVVSGQAREAFTSGEDTNISFTTIIQPTVDSDVEIYLEGGAQTLTPVFAQLVVTRLD